MDIEPFAVEIWMNAHETRCAFNLAETCVESLTIAELLAITGHTAADLEALLPLPMTYGAIRGSERLRRAIAATYARQQPGDILVTHGTIGANMLVHKALVGRGDRVVTVVPTYQQHWSIPASLGADVQQVHLRAEDGWLPDLDALHAAVTPGTRLLAINNANTPTGALMDDDLLGEVAAIAEAAGAWVLCDEVYRGTDQQGPGTSASIADISPRGISTCGMSKAYSLAGLRLGWIAAPAEVVEAVSIHRDYDTISVGVLDDHFAAIALEHREALLERSRAITRANLQVLGDWVDGEPRVDWVRPQAGTTALLALDVAMPSEAFCRQLLDATGVLLMPGSALGVEGHVRIGFANNGAVLAEGLCRLSAFLGNLP